ncbi:kanadaptin isoform X2 [Eucyclogobius newberryi]|uniref:kanadaptin isoform X2 n=1 Tax=Eucyclogobius newberryi TaxID=166745 RepID=UPI003B5CE4FC
MAASPSSEERVENEINLTMDSPEATVTDHKDQTETETAFKAEMDADEPFKKPALFAAPSMSTKRPATAPTKKPTPDSETASKGDKKDTNAEAQTKPDTETVKEEDTNDPNKHTIKTKHESKSKDVLPKGPPPGKFPLLPYTEPIWGSEAPDYPYSIEILKNGAIVNTIPLKDKSYFVVGRLPVCDVSLEHPSISRYHAIIQYRGESGGEAGSVGEERGFYVQDLGSTHGTVVNKNKIPPNTYIRIKVGHVMKFGGSTRLFILQGPESDEEEESEFTVTELKERARKQREELEKRMMGAGSDDDDEEVDKGENGEDKKSQSKQSKDDSGCSWGIGDDAVAEDEDEENPFSTEFQEDQEAAYLKDPKKTLQGFYDREGEELEFEYEDKGSGTWLCRIKLPVDDAKGKQLVAEVTNTGKKKDVTVQCCLEACRMLEARGLLRQEAVSRKRKKKNWEDEDYYDSDDDTFLDRTGTVERKRQERMKKAGKIEERTETYQSLLAKLAGVEKELKDTQKKLEKLGSKDSSGSSTEDPLDAFMTAVRSEAAMDGVERRKLHVHVADLKKETLRLRKLVELTRPAQLPSLLPSSSSGAEKAKKALPLFGAMKGGSKFKLKTGTIGKFPPKRPNLPAELFNMKELPAVGAEEEEEEEEDESKHKMEDSDQDDDNKDCVTMSDPDMETRTIATEENEEGMPKPRLKERSIKAKKGADPSEAAEEVNKSPIDTETSPEQTCSESKLEGNSKTTAEASLKKKKKVIGRPPVPLTGGKYPDDDPDYCVWVPPVGKTGDGRTHLNDKYGY